MARPKTKVCDVTGLKTSERNFYKNQSHVKAVDNIRRTTGASVERVRELVTLINN